MTTTMQYAMRRVAMVAACAAASWLAAGGARADAEIPVFDPTDYQAQLMQDALAKYDVDHDGKLSLSEKAAFRRDILQKIAPMRREALRKYDWDHNGRIEGEERLAMRRDREAQHARAEARALENFDANHNGTLEPEEQAARKAARDAWLETARQRALLVYDANGNGLLDPDEKTAIREQVESARQVALELYDMNLDGRLDAAERSLANSTEGTPRRANDASLSGSRAVPVSVTAGGTVQAGGGAVLLRIPAGALTAPANVSMVASPRGGETLEQGRRVFGTCTFMIKGGSLKDAATLDMSYAAVAKSVTPSNLLLARWTGEAWEDLASTTVEATTRVTAEVTASGRYALLERAGAAPGFATISNLKINPTGGRGFRDGADIAFSLGSPGGVTVKVFDTAGRLVRMVANRQSFAAGEQVIRWDGRGSDGRGVANGLYFITVEGPANRMTRKVSFFR